MTSTTENKVINFQLKIPKSALKHKVSQDLINHWAELEADIIESMQAANINKNSEEYAHIQKNIANMAGLVFDVTGLILYNEGNPKEVIQLFHKSRNCLNHQAKSLKQFILN